MPPPSRPALRPLHTALLSAALFLGGCASLPSPDPPMPGGDAAEPREPVVRTPPPRPTPPVPAEAPDVPPPAPLHTGSAVFERLAARLSPPVCVHGDRNQAWRRRYTAHPEGLERQLRDALPLIAYVLEEVEARDLPGEFVLIPLIESGYRPEARGPGGPLGLWQMIGSTARNHGVRVSPTYDGRLSPVDATTAALDYLAALHREFGDWRATAMAYNAGEGRLRRAFARHGDERVSGERQWPAGLAPVTYTYITKLHALACLVKEPERHGLRLPPEGFTPIEVRSAPTGVRTVDEAAHHWAVPVDGLLRLNPAYRRGTALRHGPGRFLVPRDASTGPTIAPTVSDTAPRPAAIPRDRQHQVRAGETLWRIARRYGTTVGAITAANGLEVDRPLRIGQRLRIPD